jgi:hypothetical protein
VTQLTNEEMKQLRTSPVVHSIHTNDGVQPFQPPPPPPPDGTAPDRQARAPWNLNRISHASLPVTAGYTWASDGSGVNVYILDTVRPVAQVDTPAIDAMQLFIDIKQITLMRSTLW